MKLPLHVLYLEDDTRDAELVQDTLAAQGITCRIRRVETETDFLAALNDGGFEIILADYTVPGLDGVIGLEYRPATFAGRAIHLCFRRAKVQTMQD
jgi:DNA-binding response OmpR family regulator